jgi:hypothetical protein
MTILERLRGILTTDPHRAALSAARVDFGAPGTIADQIRAQWEDATVRDPVFREAATRVAIVAEPGVSWLWRYSDQSVLTANDQGVWAR